MTPVVRLLRGMLATALLIAAVAATALPTDVVAQTGRSGRPVITEYRGLAGYREPHTPEKYNRAFYLRYYNGTPTTTVIVLMPGVFLGATSLDGLARQLVARTDGTEIWALDRRSNQFEERGASREALSKNDPTIAYRYYVTNVGKPGGFTPVTRAQLSFEAYWGLETHLRDLHQVVLEARKRASRVVIGGHSLGATTTSLYAAYKFDASRTGQDFVQGLLLLDGVVGRTGGGAGAQISSAVADLESGKTEPYNAAVTTYLVGREARNLLALMAPQEGSPAGFLTEPATNEAVAGLYESLETSPLPLLSSTVGAPVGARLTHEPRPPGSVLRIAPAVRNLAGLESGATQIAWRVGAPTDHPVDLASYLRADVQPLTNFSEWYFPSRFTLDLTSITVPLENQRNLIPNRLVTLPTLALGAGRGYLTDADVLTAYRQARPAKTIRLEVVPSYTHMDMITANRDNANVPFIQEWIAQLPTAPRR